MHCWLSTHGLVLINHYKNSCCNIFDLAERSHWILGFMWVFSFLFSFTSLYSYNLHKNFLFSVLTYGYRKKKKKELKVLVLSKNIWNICLHLVACISFQVNPRHWSTDWWLTTTSISSAVWMKTPMKGKDRDKFPKSTRAYNILFNCNMQFFNLFLLHLENYLGLN